MSIANQPPNSHVFAISGSLQRKGHWFLHYKFPYRKLESETRDQISENITPPKKKQELKRPFSLPKAITSTKVPTSYHLNFFKYILNCPVNNPRIRFWAIHGESLATAGLSICKSSSYKYSIDQIQSYYPNEMRNRYVLLVVHYSAKHTSYSNITWKNLS